MILSVGYLIFKFVGSLCNISFFVGHFHALSTLGGPAFPQRVHSSLCKRVVPSDTKLIFYHFFDLMWVCFWHFYSWQASWCFPFWGTCCTFHHTFVTNSEETLVGSIHLWRILRSPLWMSDHTGCHRDRAFLNFDRFDSSYPSAYRNALQNQHAKCLGSPRFSSPLIPCQSGCFSWISWRSLARCTAAGRSAWMLWCTPPSAWCPSFEYGPWDAPSI